MDKYTSAGSSDTGSPEVVDSQLSASETPIHTQLPISLVSEPGQGLNPCDSAKCITCQCLNLGAQAVMRAPLRTLISVKTDRFRQLILAF
jgi:hypothetical protein